MQDQIPLEQLAPTWVYWFSLLAGVVGLLEEIRPEDTKWVKFQKGVSRVFSSMMAGLLTYQFLHAAGVPEIWHIPLTGVGAHMGTEALKQLGSIWKQKLGITKDTNGDQK